MTNFAGLDVAVKQTSVCEELWRGFLAWRTDRHD